MNRPASRIIAALAALIIGLVGLTSALNANAEDNVFTFTTAPGEITFINNGNEDITVSYTDGEEVDGEVVVPPHDRVVVEAFTEHLMFSATGEAGLVGQAEWPGIDLTGDFSEHPVIDFTYTTEPGKITWLNQSDVDIIIDYGDGKDVSGTVILPATGSVSVEADTAHLMWSASVDDGLVGQMECPGVDISKPKVDEPAKDKPAKKPNLPKSGV